MPPDKTAMIHLYRGELGRMTAYRIRLDTTSNWALGASVAVVTFTLGNPEAPHAVLILPVLLTAVFALLEARRLQDLELIRSRVRILEQGFFADQLGHTPSDPDWPAQLARSLAEPVSPLSLLDGVCVRIARNYVWLFLTLYAAWWLKLWVMDGTVRTSAHLRPVPGAVVIGIATALLVLVMLLAMRARPVLPG